MKKEKSAQKATLTDLWQTRHIILDWMTSIVSVVLFTAMVAFSCALFFPAVDPEYLFLGAIGAVLFTIRVESIVTRKRGGAVTLRILNSIVGVMVVVLFVWTLVAPESATAQWVTPQFAHMNAIIGPAVVRLVVATAFVWLFARSLGLLWRLVVGTARWEDSPVAKVRILISMCIIAIATALVFYIVSDTFWTVYGELIYAHAEWLFGTSLVALYVRFLRQAMSCNRPTGCFRMF